MKADSHIAMTQPADPGPVYAETDMSRIPVEPWNTASNLIFLVVIIYWSIKTKLNVRNYPLISVALPILGIGFIGGTVYHATRSHAFWLYLDYMPILILVLSACIYLWQRLLNKWRYTLLATLGPLLLYRIFFEFSSLPEKFLISAGYSVLALSILLPAILHCWFKNRKNWYWLALSLGAFVIAISSRQLDNGSVKDFLPMGSHFLWHIFGGISTFFLIQYLYTSDNVLNLEKQQTAKGDKPDYAGKDNFESGLVDNIQ